jgi:hypothetical protein
VDSIIEHLRSFQETDKLNHRVNHSEKERFIGLEGRDKTISEAVVLLKRSYDSYAKDIADRTGYPFIVFNGMSGLGKTRMLEEGLGLLEKAGIPEPHHTALVMYGNGTPPSEDDDILEIEASFSWRLLHGLFVDGNCKAEGNISWTSSTFLPQNAAELDLKTALEVIAKAAKSMKRARKSVKGAAESLLEPILDEDVLSLVIGVDEYQKIPWGPNSKGTIDDREKSFLWKLLGALQACSSSPVKGLHIYPMCAGTSWGPMNIGNSSIAHVQRVSMPLLRPREVEKVIDSADPDFLVSHQNRDRSCSSWEAFLVRPSNLLLSS